jgi:hypothetical protein
LFALAGCSEGHDDLSGTPDLAMAADAGETPDLSDFDLLGPSCGKIVICIFTCGVTDLTCDQTCVAGAQPAAIQQAGALTLCAAQNCLGGLGGDGGVNPNNMLAIIACLEQMCPKQINACQDLPFAAPQM